MINPQPRPMDDLEVQVADYDQLSDLYAVRVTLADGRNFLGTMQLGDLRPLPLQSDGNALESYGLDLFNRLFNDALADAFDYAWAAAKAKNHGLRLRLWLESAKPRLHEIPWELLSYDDSGGVAPPTPLAANEHVAFSRYLASTKPWGQPIQQRPLKMLVVVAAPTDLGTAWRNLAPIDKAMETRDFRSVFNTMANSGQLAFDFLEAATAEDLHAALETGYHVLLYYGHGIHHPRLGTHLLLEDRTGVGKIYDGAELVQRTGQSEQRPYLVVLVACNTATEHDDYPLGSLAAQLVREGGVPAVLAMQRLVEVSLARSFTHHLSEFLLQHGIVDVAVSSARRRIAEFNEVGWSTPVLYMRSADGRLFAPNAPLDYARALQEDRQFVRWQQPDFIRVETIAVPQGQHWQLLQYRPQDAPPGKDALEALQQELRLEQEQVQPNLIALIGPPRSGQTTTLQRLAIDMADAAQRGQTPRRTIGIYVPLESYGQGRSGSRQLEHLIIDMAHEKVPALGEELQHLFRTAQTLSAEQREAAGYVFLLDGLDAIPEGQRHSASREIVALAQSLPHHRVVVSCTHHRFPVKTFEQAQILLLQPLNERQVLRYLRQRDPQRNAVIFRQMVESRLLDLAMNPALLMRIYERLVVNRTAKFTRNQFMQDLLEHTLVEVGARYNQGNIAMESLTALAWEMRWQHVDTLSVDAVFRVLAEVRHSRDYYLETLYQRLRDARLLIDVGRHVVRFVHPMVYSYCAALALYQRPDMQDRLRDIIAMCGNAERLAWWEDVLYALAGLMRDATLVRVLTRAAFVGNSSAHTLLMARCLEVLSPEAEQTLLDQDWQELVDACAIRLRVEREPSAERRAQIATALGRLRHPQAVQELRRLLVERVRNTPTGPRYDYANVRIAAARTLRTLVTQIQGVLRTDGTLAQRTAPAYPAQMLVLKDELVQADAGLFQLLWAWNDSAVGDGEARQRGLATLRTTLVAETADILERTVAAFALGDLTIDKADAARLRNLIVQAPPASVSDEEWDDITWSAADALTLFDADLVTDLLAETFAQGAPPLHCTRQIAHVAGRVRTHDEVIVRWLVELLLHNPDHVIKAVALRSLAWLGKGLPSFAWLRDVIQTLYAVHVGDQFDEIVQQVVTDIAAWNGDALTTLGTFDADEANAVATLYLRRKAIEALAWIGDQKTLDTLYPTVPQWPLELREPWYVTAEAIRARLSSQVNGEQFDSSL